MSKTKIDYGDVIENVWRGCKKKSVGCKNCWAIKQVARMEALARGQKRKNGTSTLLPKVKGLTYKTENGDYNWTGEMTFDEAALKRLSKYKGKRVLINFQTDTFNPNVPNEWLHRLFDVICANKESQFFLLTKMPENMAKYMIRHSKRIQEGFNGENSHIFLGTSIENQNEANHRLNDLMVSWYVGKGFRYWVSIEPLIDKVEIDSDYCFLDFIVVGGESGKNARPIQKEWVTEIRDFAKENKIPFYFKQWGKKEFNPDKKDFTIDFHSKGGYGLDGEFHRELPKF